MSALQYKEDMSSTDLQVWNNAAFDNRDSKEFSGNKASWSPLKPILFNSTESLKSDSPTKENENPLFENPISCVSSSLKSVATPFKPVNSNRALENAKSRGISKQGFEEKVDLKSVDDEIEEIEMEIKRLTSRLESLKLEKAERRLTIEKRGRVIPAKFMEPKQSVKNVVEKKEIEDMSSVKSRTRVHRKGISLGPAEIAAGVRRGMSMGPTEIFDSAKSRKPGMITPVQPIQSRRKSCFFKLQDIDEGKGKNSSISPQSRKPILNSRVLSRQAVTTIGSKKAVKKDDQMINSIQPKKLFRDGDKSVPAKPLRAGRVVASRYNQSTSTANQALKTKKRSLPENGKAEIGGDKKRSLSIGKTHADNKNLGSESRVKKRWEILDEVVIHGSLVESENSPQSNTAVLDLLPRIRVSRCAKESPRDSGPAKRVVELIGKKSYFCNDEEVEPSVCQALSFAEAEEGIEET